MMKKVIKYTFGVVLAIIAVVNSVYFRPLDEKLSEGDRAVFDPDSYVNKIWENEILPAFGSAVDFTRLMDQLKNDPELAFKEHAHAIAVGNIGYFRVQGEGIIKTINQNNVMLDVGGQTVEIETEFIFGNAIRDASRLFQVNDFETTSDLNSISESINDKIRKEVIPDFRADVEAGDRIVFSGAIELNKTHLDLNMPEIIPVSIKIMP